MRLSQAYDEHRACMHACRLRILHSDINVAMSAQAAMSTPAAVIIRTVKVAMGSDDGFGWQPCLSF